MILLYFSVLVYQPSKPDSTTADLTSWLALECEATEKYSADGAYEQDVPSGVYSSFSFIQAELQNGWFAIKIEPDDQDEEKTVTKVSA